MSCTTTPHRDVFCLLELGEYMERSSCYLVVATTEGDVQCLGSRVVCSDFSLAPYLPCHVLQRLCCPEAPGHRLLRAPCPLHRWNPPSTLTTIPRMKTPVASKRATLGWGSGTAKRMGSGWKQVGRAFRPSLPSIESTSASPASSVATTVHMTPERLPLCLREADAIGRTPPSDRKAASPLRKTPPPQPTGGRQAARRCPC